MVYPVTARITQHFGDGATQGIKGNPNPNSGMGFYVYLYGNYQPDGHTGIDQGSIIGDPVVAVADGVVLHAGTFTGTYRDNPWWIEPSFIGKGVVIDHGDFIGIYGHHSVTRCKAGQGVEEGQHIADSGSSGASAAPHHHFEVLPDGYNLNSKYYGRVNPIPYIERQETGDDEVTPEQARMLKAVYDAIFNGGTSMPEGKPLKDLIHDNFTTTRAVLSRVEANTK